MNTPHLLPAFVGTPEVNRIYCMDALALLRALPTGSVDLVLTDPPYGVHEAAWDIKPNFPTVMREFERIITPQGAVVITCVMRVAYELISCNPNFFKYDWVAIKDRSTDMYNAHNKPMRAHEHVLVFSHGTTANGSSDRMNYYPQMRYDGRIWERMDYARTKAKEVFGGRGRTHAQVDTIRQGTEYRYPTTVILQRRINLNTLHPNQKDLGMFETLCASYTCSGDLVVDPFAGSGTTAVAARNLGRRFIAGDSDAGYCEVARRRLAQPYTPNMFDTLIAQEMTT